MTAVLRSLAPARALPVVVHYELVVTAEENNTLNNFRHSLILILKLLKRVPFPANAFALLGILLILASIRAWSALLFLTGAALFFLATSWYFFLRSSGNEIWYQGDKPPGWWETTLKGQFALGLLFLALFAACCWFLYQTPEAHEFLRGGLRSVGREPGSGSSPPVAVRAALDRGLPGLELGISVEDARKSFKLQEATDPVASLLAKYGKKAAADETIAVNKLLGKQFFRVEPANGRLPKGVNSVEALFANNVLYQIRLHYGSDHVAKVGWQAVTLPYLARYGRPTRDEGSSYSWGDERTRLDIEASGDIVNLFYIDLAIEHALRDYEFKATDLLRRQKQK